MPALQAYSIQSFTNSFSYRIGLQGYRVHTVGRGMSRLCSWTIQYRYLNPALLDRTPACAWLYKHHWITCQNIYQADRWPTTHANQSYVQLWVYPCIHAQETGWQSGVRSCHSLAARALSAGIKCRYCSISVYFYGLSETPGFTILRWCILTIMEALFWWDLLCSYWTTNSPSNSIH